MMMMMMMMMTMMTMITMTTMMATNVMTMSSFVHDWVIIFIYQ